MRNSTHASVTTVLMKSYAKLTRTEMSEDYSYLHSDVFVHCLWHVQWHCLLKCPMPAVASSEQHSPTLSSFRPTFCPPSARRGCSIRSRCLRSRGDACQQSSKSKAPPTKITARVKAQQPGRSELPSLQEAVRDGDPAMTDKQSHVWRWGERRKP